MDVGDIESPVPPHEEGGANPDVVNLAESWCGQATGKMRRTMVCCSDASQSPPAAVLLCTTSCYSSGTLVATSCEIGGLH